MDLKLLFDVSFGVDFYDDEDSGLDEDADEMCDFGSRESFVSELFTRVVCAPSLSRRGEVVVLLKPNFLVEEAFDLSEGFENLENMLFFWTSGVFLSEAWEENFCVDENLLFNVDAR